MQHPRSSWFCLILSGLAPLLAVANGSPQPTVTPEPYPDGITPASFGGAFPERVAPRDLSKRQTLEELCGANYVVCENPLYCCKANNRCEYRINNYYCFPISVTTDAPPSSTFSSLEEDPTPSEEVSSEEIETFSSEIFEPTTTDEPYSPTITNIFDDPTPTDYQDNTNTDTDTDTDLSTGSKKKKGGLATGAIIGIAVGAALVLIIAAVIIFFVMRNSKKKAAAAAVGASAPPPAPPMVQQPPPPQPYMSPPPQTFSPPPQQQYPPQGYYPPPQGQYPAPGQYPQGYPPQAAYPPPSPAPPYGYAGAADSKQPTPGAGYYQPGHNGAVEAMSDGAISPAPTPAATQVGPPQKPNLYEM